MDTETLLHKQKRTRKLTEDLLQQPHIQPKFIALRNAIREFSTEIAPSHPDDERFRAELIEAFAFDIESHIKEQMAKRYSKGELYADMLTGHTGTLDIDI